MSGADPSTWRYNDRDYGRRDRCLAQPRAHLDYRQCVDARNLRGILAEPQAFAADSS